MHTSAVDCEIMGWTLETILSKFAVGTSPLVRQASCVWLLTVLKLAGKHPDVQVLMSSYNVLCGIIIDACMVQFSQQTCACIHVCRKF